MAYFLWGGSDLEATPYKARNQKNIGTMIEPLPLLLVDCGSVEGIMWIETKQRSKMLIKIMGFIGGFEIRASRAGTYLLACAKPMLATICGHVSLVCLESRGRGVFTHHGEVKTGIVLLVVLRGAQ